MQSSHHPTRSFVIIYCLLVILELLAEQLQGSGPGARYFLFFTKPLAMLSLGVYVFLQSQKGKAPLELFLFTSIFFSWLGDIFLMFHGELWFMLGLGSFLLAQVSYAWLFGRSSGTFLKKQPWWIIPFLAYGIGLMALLWPNLGGLRIPVAIYAMAILLMNLMALSRYGNTSLISFRWVMAGAILFLISDSLIALNKFYQPISGHRMAIMSTYLLAEFLLVIGWLKRREKP